MDPVNATATFEVRIALPVREKIGVLKNFRQSLYTPFRVIQGR